MNIGMNGQKILQVTFPNGELIRTGTDCDLWLSATYHGDRDEFWVIVEKGSQEISRHNCKYIESIDWLE